MSERHKLFYLTNDQAAEVLNISPRTLERLRLNGTGPPFRKAGPGKGARVLYRPEEIENWLDQYRYSSTAEYDDN